MRLAEGGATPRPSPRQARRDAGVRSGPGQPAVLTTNQALDLLGGEPGARAASACTGQPLLAVALDDAERAGRVGACARDLPCVTVGIAGPRAGSGPGPGSGDAGVRAGSGSGPDDAGLPHHPPQGFDVLVCAEPDPPPPWVGVADADEALGWIAGTVAGAPFAAVSLVQLLRSSVTLPVPDALVAESFVYSMLQSGPEFRAWLASRAAVGTGPGDAVGRAAGGVTSSASGGPVGAEQPTEPSVLVTRSGEHLEIRLNRPSVHNALNTAMRDALVEALAMVIADPSIETVRLSGAGPDFCSGGDLTEFGTAPDPVTAHLVRTTRSIAAALHRCRRRVTADVRGACTGAGVELPAFAGRVHADPGTSFLLPELTMGLIPGAGGTVGIARRIGRHRTAYLALSGRALPVTTARRWGLVDQILPSAAR